MKRRHASCFLLVCGGGCVSGLFGPASGRVALNPIVTKQPMQNLSWWRKPGWHPVDQNSQHLSSPWTSPWPHLKRPALTVAPILAPNKCDDLVSNRSTYLIFACRPTKYSSRPRHRYQSPVCSNSRNVVRHMQSEQHWTYFEVRYLPRVI